jgi:AcrR family transcriptional regulator
VARPSIANERRPAILAAAMRAVTERGFDGVRLADVASQAHVSVGTIQHYFGSKDALLAATFVEANRSSIERARASAAGAGAHPWARLEAIVLHFTKLERWSLWFELWAASNRYPELRRAIAEAYEAWRAPVTEAILDGVEAGTFRPRLRPEALSAAVVAFVDGLGIQDQLRLDWLGRAQAAPLLLAALAEELAYQPPAMLRPAG